MEDEKFILKQKENRKIVGIDTFFNDDDAVDMDYNHSSSKKSEKSEMTDSGMYEKRFSLEDRFDSELKKCNKINIKKRKSVGFNDFINN